jgi:hypothetical protein
MNFAEREASTGDEARGEGRDWGVMVRVGGNIRERHDVVAEVLHGREWVLHPAASWPSSLS